MLEERHLLDIKDLFILIRSHSYDNDIQSLHSDLIKLDEKQALVNYLSTGLEKDILMYCFNNLREFITSERVTIAGDFADSVHNLPEIFFYRYNLKQYWNTYIKPFRKKHGKHFFIQFKPNFNGMNEDFSVKR